MIFYTPAVFERVPSLAAAKKLVLNSGKLNTAARWKRETAWTASVIFEHARLTPESHTLDVGCGVGRLAKVIINNNWGRVTGVDISQKMRELAIAYVASPKFTVHPNTYLAALPANTFDLALAVWVLQHDHTPEYTIRHVARVLKPTGALLVINEGARFLPTEDTHGNFSWATDHIDVRKLLEQHLATRRHGLVPSELKEQGPNWPIYWLVMKKRT
jgi:ubiquinone/menaquinone biosynthesis C-methylase UbiE